jgi:hypothetical protein
MRYRLAALAVIAVLLVGCSSGKNSGKTASDSSTPSPRPAGSSSTAAVTLPTHVLDCAAKTATSTPPAARQDLVNVSVDAASRVLFEFKDGVPGYDVKYISRPVKEDASGQDVTVAGDAVLSVVMKAASGTDLNGAATYHGPARVNGAGSVTEVVRTGDSEGVLSWAIGLRSKLPFEIRVCDKHTLLVAALP